MANEDVLTMVARLQDETPAAFKQLQDNIEKTAKHPGIRDLGARFKELGGMLSPVTGVIKDALIPTLNTLGITSLSVSGVIGGLAYGLAKFSAGALGMKVVADQARITTGELQRLRDVADELDVSTEEMDATIAHFGKTVLEMTGGPGQTMTGGAVDIFQKMVGHGEQAIVQFNEIQEHLRRQPGDTLGAWKMVFEAMDKMNMTADKRALWLEAWNIPKKLADDYLETYDRIKERQELNTESAKKFNEQWKAMGREADDFAKTIFNIVGPTMTDILRMTREAWQYFANSKPPAWFAYLMTENPAEKLKKIFEGINRTPLKTDQSWWDWMLHGPPRQSPWGSGGEMQGRFGEWPGAPETGGGGTGGVQTAPVAPDQGAVTPRPSEQPPIAPGTQGAIPNQQGPAAPTAPGAPQPMQPTSGVFGFGKGSPADLFSGRTPGEFAWGERAARDNPLFFQSGTQKIETTGGFPGSGGSSVTNEQQSDGMRNLATAFKHFAIQPPQGIAPGQEGAPPADTFAQRFGGIPTEPATEGQRRAVDPKFGSRPTTDEPRTFGPAAPIPGWIRKEGPDLFSGMTPGSFEPSTEALDKSLWFQSGQQTISGGADISIDVNGGSRGKNGARRQFKETTVNRSQMMGPADTSSDGDTKSDKFGVE
jgi:hypothetical protein